MKNLLFVLIGIIIGAFCSTFVFLYICKKESCYVNNVSLMEDSLKLQVVKYGNSDAYWKLYTSCLPADELCMPARKQYDILSYDLLMAEKYNDKRACYEVYQLFVGYRNNIFGTDEKTKLRELALYYLRKGSELDDYNCTKTIYNLLQREQLPPQDWKPIQYYKEKADSLFSVYVKHSEEK